jgi:hypothetical protein
VHKKIDKKIIDATECEKSFECLTNQANLCKVKLCLAGEVHFLRCDDKKCKFKAYFGKEPLCTCPVRKEIYNRDKI